jgi:exosome complex RNA-binding protein Rrp4
VRSSLAVPFSRMIVSRGHGTYVDNDEVVASVAGTIERVNKLVTVRALRTRYPDFKFSIDLPV